VQRVSMEILYEIFSSIPQQGPGNNESTLKALSMIPSLSENSKILDIGCGTGRQTLTLAKAAKSEITAMDNYQPFLDKINEKAKSEGLSNIKTLCSTMDDMILPDDYFDLIWSEGAIYIIGFKEGLEYWKRFVKPGGYIAVTEAAWFIDNPPDEVKKFWESEYPGITTIEENLRIIKDLGYVPVNHFKLPNIAWLDNFYNPLEQRLPMLRGKYANNIEDLRTIESVQYEIDIYRKYSDFYGYVFFVMQRSE